jgi:hypothetical protein
MKKLFTLLMVAAVAFGMQAQEYDFNSHLAKL